MGIRQYHAELVPVLVAAAISGVGLVVAAGDRLRRGWGRPILYLFLLWLAASTLVGQYRQGFTPLRPGFSLLPVTPHHQAAKEIMSLVPPDAPVAVSQELGPYLTRRQKLYYFLTESAAEADYLIIDILRNRWGDHAQELQQEVLRFIDQQNFGVVAAKDGVILLGRDEPNKAMPQEFFSFAQVNSLPALPVSIRFGGEVEFLGLDIRPGSVLNDTADTVNVTGYWRLLKPASQDYVPALFFDTAGPVVGARGHPPGLVWYPVSQWPPGEIVKIDYPPPIWLVRLRSEFDISVGVAQGSDEWAPAARLAPQLRLPEEAFSVVPGQNLVTVASVPQENRLPGAPSIKASTRRYSPPGSVKPLSVDFQGELSLVGYDMDTAVTGPPAKLDFTLYWQAQKEMAEAYTVFVHLYGGEGRLRAQRDGEPVQGSYPTSAWRPREVVADRRELSLDGLAPGEYSLEVGVYLRDSGQRLQGVREGKTLPEGRAMVSKVSIPYP